jgi:uncharacterized membrane protein
METDSYTKFNYDRVDILPILLLLTWQRASKSINLYNQTYKQIICFIGIKLRAYTTKLNNRQSDRRI